MSKLLTGKVLAIISTLIVLYFSALSFVYLNGIDWVIIGVFREMLTIPLLIAMLVFLVWSIVLVIKEKRRDFLSLYSVLILSICTIFTIDSFF